MRLKEREKERRAEKEEEKSIPTESNKKDERDAKNKVKSWDNVAQQQLCETMKAYQIYNTAS